MRSTNNIDKAAKLLNGYSQLKQRLDIIENNNGEVDRIIVLVLRRGEEPKNGVVDIGEFPIDSAISDGLIASIKAKLRQIADELRIISAIDIDELRIISAIDIDALDDSHLERAHKPSEGKSE